MALDAGFAQPMLVVRIVIAPAVLRGVVPLEAGPRAGRRRVQAQPHTQDLAGRRRAGDGRLRVNVGRHEHVGAVVPQAIQFQAGRTHGLQPVGIGAQVADGVLPHAEVGVEPPLLLPVPTRGGR